MNKIPAMILEGHVGKIISNIRDLRASSGSGSKNTAWILARTFPVFLASLNPSVFCSM
jgi:hypothetical protein